MRVHLDTDFGGDPDDACALVMLLGYPDVEIVGITTNLDSGGRRAGYVQRTVFAPSGVTGATLVPGSNGGDGPGSLQPDACKGVVRRPVVDHWLI